MASTIKSVEERKRELIASGMTEIDAQEKALREQNAQRAQVYNQQVDADVAKQTDIYEDSISGVERAEKAQLDYNHIDELVARKNLKNTMADMGLTDSGLNRSQQTAISVMRGNADAKARQTSADKVQSFRDAIDQVMVEGEQKKTTYQQGLDDTVATWRQNAISQLHTNALSSATESYNAEVEALQKMGMDQTSNRSTYAMTLIKQGVAEDEAWASAYVQYPTGDEKIDSYYIAYREGVGKGYTGDALEAYANAGGGSAGKAAAQKVVYGKYDSELIDAGVTPKEQTKFYSGRWTDFASTEAEDIAVLRNADQDAWNASASKILKKARENISKTGLSDETKKYAEAKAIGEQFARIWALYRNVDDDEKNVLSVKTYNALGSVLSGDMLLVAAQAAGLTVEN